MAWIRTGLSGGSGGIPFSLTVTTDQDFIGETLIFSNGTITFTEEVPSSMTVVFGIPVTGTWILTNTLNPDTDTIEISADYTYELTNTPDGKTVLPVNDIQTWLKCAKIRDKAYTTLAEVLADKDTLVKLMADDNAVDYMVRSTEWAVPISVPVMTSNTSPEGECIISSQYSTYPAYLSFDRDETTRGTYTGVANGYIGYVFPTAVQCIYAEIYPQANFTGETFYIQGSDDGITWNNLSEALTNLTVEKHKVALSNNSAKRYYRLTNTTRNLSYSGYAVFTLQFYSASITADSTAMSLIGANNYAANTLLADATWCEAIGKSEYVESVCNVKVPKMTSATTPSGTVFGSQQYSSFAPYKAFDEDLSTCFYSNVANSYVGYQFPSTEKIYIAKIFKMTGCDATQRDFNIFFDASEDGVTYNSISDTEVYRMTDGTTVTDQVFVLTPTEANYFRMHTAVTGYSWSARPYVVQFYGREDV